MVPATLGQLITLNKGTTLPFTGATTPAPCVEVYVAIGGPGVGRGAGARNLAR